MVPDLDSSTHLVLLETVAARIMEHHGLAPIRVESEKEAFELCNQRRADRYPLVLTPLDTGGEKAFEVFVAATEELRRDTGIEGLHRVLHNSLCDIEELVAEIESVVAGHGPREGTAEFIVELLRRHVPTLPQRRPAASLDERI